MSPPLVRPALDRMLSRSVLGTALVLAGGALLLTGCLYGIAIGLVELRSSHPSGPTPASSGSVLGSVAVVLLFGSTFVVLGGQLIGYAR